MEKLFELDPYLTHFTACVQSCVQSRKGWDVILDQTAFYPEGGGQPYDLGTLGRDLRSGGPRAGGPCSPHLRPPAGARLPG